MNGHLPCLIYSRDAVLCDEKDVLPSADDILTLADLDARFKRALYGDTDDFTEFCSSSDGGFRFYRIRCFSKCVAYRFAFCEKAEILGENLTAVYLAYDVHAFYPLMSPSSQVIRTTADTLTYELLKIKSSAESGSTSLSAEAFSVASRIPRLCEAVYDRRSRARYCDLISVTEHAVESIVSAPAFSSTVGIGVKRGVFRSESGGYSGVADIIEIPVEAYTAVLSVMLNIAASLSSEHRIALDVSYYSYAADIVITTVTDKLGESVGLAGPRYLCRAGVREDLVRIAETVAYIAGIDLSVSYESGDGSLRLVIGLGYEMASIPDFKFSDPIEFVREVADEIAGLMSVL